MTRYLLVLISKSPRFAKDQVKTIVDILVGLGLVFVGTTSLPLIFKDGPYSWAFAGVVGSIIVWYIAIRLSRRLSNDN